ncbi:MAG TPA: AzlD domain-containing protein [Solirubrobacterales bacterium]|nr:AzlD domain-containing protein [Solirubrobacterales bacterium]
MSDVWTTVVVLAAATALIRASGPVGLGGRELQPMAMRVISLLAASLLAALVVVETFAGGDDTLELDARALGVAAAAGVLWVRHDALLWAVGAAAAVAALARVI